MPEAAVRLRSCKRHGETFSPITASSARFIFDQPLIGEVPVVVNTKSPSMRGTAARMSRATGGSGTACGR